ncbi:MAG: hypothetical protein SX243_01520 [Acidobacteriota bacterium]|nr:hypothetical protein [Acidobacteriota bacterium]
MSISFMTNVAVAHSVARSGAHSGKRGSEVPKTRSLAAVSHSAQGAAGQTPEINKALDVIMAYIPTEILTVYVPVLAMLETTAGKVVGFQGFLIATPIVVWLLFAAKLRTASGTLPLNPKAWPWWEMVAATLAFFVWACALDDNAVPLAINESLAGILVLISAPALGLLAPIFRSPTAPALPGSEPEA